MAKKVGGLRGCAKIVDMTEEQVGRWRAGKARMPLYAAIQLSQAAGVSIDWLATGEGAEENAFPPRKGAAEHQAVYAHDGDLSGDFVLVPRYDVEASAGSGALNDHEQAIDHMAFREDWVRRTLHVNPAELALITAVGDSMEPTIRAGDLMLIDTGVNAIQDDAIYVLVKRGELIVKRVQQFFTGAVAIKSDNAAYVEETIGPDEIDAIQIAGRVRWVGRLY